MHVAVRPAQQWFWRIAAVARRDLLVEVSYQFRLTFYFVTALVSAFMAFYISELVGAPEQLAQFDGTYFDYVIVGLALLSYAGLGVSTVTSQLGAEQSAGTLEVLLAGPTRLFMLLFGGFLVPLVLTTIEVVLLIGIGVGRLGTGISLDAALLAVPIVVLTVANFCAMGIASAAVALLVKRGDPISGPLYQATLVLSGAVFPVELFPSWLEAIARVTPAYYGVRAMHEALLTAEGVGGVVDELLVLAAFAAVLLPLSLWLFTRSVAQAKRYGILGSY